MTKNLMLLDEAGRWSDGEDPKPAGLKGSMMMGPYIHIDHPFHLKNDLKFAFTYSDDFSVGSSVCSGLRNSLDSSFSSLSLVLDDTDHSMEASSSSDEESFVDRREEIPSWRLPPNESKADWTMTIQSVPEGIITQYHVHKTVLVNNGHINAVFFEKLFNHTDITDPTRSIKVHEDAAKLIPNMLDYMYAIDGQLLVSSESAVGLRHLSQFFGIRALAKRVGCFINEDITLDNIGIYLETTAAFDDLETAKACADRCAVEVENINPSSPLLSEMDPSFILDIVSSPKFNRKKHSKHMSHIIAGYFIKHIGTIDGCVFEELTSIEYLPSIDEQAAFPLLMIEARLISESANERTSLTSLQRRCIKAILPSFRGLYDHSISDVCKKSRRKAMHKIPKKVLVEVLSKLSVF